MKKSARCKLLVVLALFSLASCKEKDEAVAERLVGLMEEMASIADENKADCKTMGDELAMLVTSKRKLIAHAKKIRQDSNRSTLFVEKHRERVEAAGKKMLRGLLKCGSHAKVRAAIKTTLIK